jgi:hypothetical protein
MPARKKSVASATSPVIAISARKGRSAGQAEQGARHQAAQAEARRADHVGHREGPVLQAVAGHVGDQREHRAVEQLLAGGEQHGGHRHGDRAAGRQVGQRAQRLQQLGGDHDQPGADPVHQAAG